MTLYGCAQKPTYSSVVVDTLLSLVCCITNVLRQTACCTQLLLQTRQSKAAAGVHTYVATDAGGWHYRMSLTTTQWVIS